MKHAFLIMAHEQPQILARLLLALQHERVEIFLHIDCGARFTWEEVAAEMEKVAQQPHRSCIHLLQPAQEVHWGDVSQVKIELRLLAAAREHGDFVHYHWLSGIDFLLHPVEEILQFFDAHAHQEFIGFWNSPAHRRNVEKRTRYYYPFTAYLQKSRHRLAHQFTTPLRKVALIAQKLVNYRRFGDESFYKGYNWASITQEFAEHLLQHRESILRKYQGVLAPDEIYKQTEWMRASLNTQLFDGTNEERGSQRHIDWERGHPYTFQSGNLPELDKTSVMFARKVSLDCADALLKKYL